MSLLIPLLREPERFGTVIGHITTPEQETVAVVEPFSEKLRRRALSIPDVEELPEDF